MLVIESLTFFFGLVLKFWNQIIKTNLNKLNNNHLLLLYSIFLKYHFKVSFKVYFFEN